MTLRWNQNGSEDPSGKKLQLASPKKALDQKTRQIVAQIAQAVLSVGIECLLLALEMT